MKICAKCKNELPIGMFGIHSREKDGRNCYCKECKKRMDRKHWQENKDKINKQQRNYYSENKEKIGIRNKNYILKNMDKHREWGTKSRNKLKAEVFSHYCEGEIKCKCGVNNLYLLTIDHINGNGSEHRRKENIKTGYGTYRWLKKNNYPNGFQVLCFNCQYLKRLVEMRAENRNEKQLKAAKYVESVKAECLQHYGSVCDCGETDQIVLTLDHVNDDGVKHRAETKTKGYAFYLMLRRNRFPNDPPLQVKCLNCQYLKRKIYYEERKINKINDCSASTVFV